jgi:hypothetical protein
MPFTPGTSLEDKYVDVVSVQGASTCASGQPGIFSMQTLTINGLSFLKEIGQGHAMGQIYDTVSYSTLKDNVCVSLNLVLNSTSGIGYSTPPPVYNQAVESAVITDIVSTFT